ncbi:MAG: hypothetical protein NVS9B4_22500 [Candidatus Acidiferrum sp.]
MKVLVTFAAEAEMAVWRRKYEGHQIDASGTTIYRCRIGQARVDLAVTGMGIKNAQRVASVVLPGDYSVCICSGFAGGLNRGYKAGQVVAGAGVRQIGTGRTLKCSPELLQAAVANGALRAETMLTSATLVSTIEEKARLAGFGDAVDMESAAIIGVANEHRIPAAIIRVISDGYDHAMPVDIDKTVDEEGHVRVSRVAWYLAMHPLQLPALIRLGGVSRTAAQTLAKFLEAYIRKISFTATTDSPVDLQGVAAR